MGTAAGAENLGEGDHRAGHRGGLDPRPFHLPARHCAAIVTLSLAPGAKREIEQARGGLGGEGLITAGVVCAWVTIGLTIAAVLAVVIFIAAAGTWSVGDSMTL